MLHNDAIKFYLKLYLLFTAVGVKYNPSVGGSLTYFTQ